MSVQALATSQLIGLRVELPKFETFFLDTFFPNVLEFDTEEIHFDKVTKGKKLAPFVSPMRSGKPRRSEGGILASFKPAYLKPLDIVQPGRLLKRMAGEKLQGELSPAARRMLHIMNHLDEQDKQITRREEVMAFDAVTTGKVIVEGEDFPRQEVDFGRRPENTIALTLEERWSKQDPETYDPSADIEEWASRCASVGSMLTFSRKGWALFKNFKKVREDLKADSKGSTSSLQLGPQLARVVQYKGRYGEFECYVYAGKYDDEQGNEVEMMPNASLLISPMGYDGTRCYGAIQDAEANANGIVATARHPSNWFTKNPSVENVMTQSAPLPVIPTPNDFVFIDLD